MTMHNKSKLGEPLSVLLIDDDEAHSRAVARLFKANGVTVTVAATGRSGLAQLFKAHPDVIVLNDALPDMPGLDVCRDLRAQSDTPLIMMSADEVERVLALEGGADDVVAKPLSGRELLARVRAHARRARGLLGPAVRELSVGSLVIRSDAMRASFDGSPLALTNYEFVLLRALAERAGQVLTREQLVALMGGDVLARTVDVHISHLRQKLGDTIHNPRLLLTVRGVGYMLVAREEPLAAPAPV